MKTGEYIKNIKKSGFFSGDFEISQSIFVFRINIAVYEKIYDDNNQIIEYKFLNYLENENFANRKILFIIKYLTFLKKKLYINLFYINKFFFIFTFQIF